MIEPVGGAVIEGMYLMVLDPPNGRFSLYRFSHGSVGFERVIRASFSDPTSACSVGDRIFVHAHDGGLLIHELDADGTVRGSFGEVSVPPDGAFGVASPQVTSQRNRGRLLCLEEERLVIAVSSYVPLVRAYDLNGASRWQTVLSDWRPLGFRPSRQGGVQFDVPQGGYHIGASVVRWDARSIVVQYHVSEGSRIESRQLAIDTGIELARTELFPVIADAHGGRFYAFENEPFPRAMVLTPSR